MTHIKYKTVQVLDIRHAQLKWMIYQSKKWTNVLNLNKQIIMANYFLYIIFQIMKSMHLCIQIHIFERKIQSLHHCVHGVLTYLVASSAALGPIWSQKSL